MPKNDNLNAANKAKKDEFYTSYDDIQAELNYHEKNFRNKVIFCNCDDPFESNFCKFFLRNFNYLGLKRLICTSYASSVVVGTQMSLFDDFDQPVKPKHGYVLDINEVPMKNGRGVSDDDIYDLLHERGIVKRLKGNGDYASDECLSYLKDADIVVTNPPFSKFRDYIELLKKYNKKYLVIGNLNALTYKQIFPLIQENKIWFGASIHSGDREFRVPNDYPLKASGTRIDNDGNKYIRVKGVRWYTNLDFKQRHEDLILYKRYNPNEFPKFDNYDAINVGKTSDIPMDYEGVMGVPITFFDKFNPDQFEILGATESEGRGFSNGIWDERSQVRQPLVNGKKKYKRIFIRNKKVQK